MVYNKNTHNELLDIGMKSEGTYETGHIINHLSIDDISVILATMKVKNANSDAIWITERDLRFSKYKIYDWLGMLFSGSHNCIENETILKILVGTYIFAKGHVEYFVELLRNQDYNKNDDYWKNIKVFEDLKQLTEKRNKLNREIATLKKANLKN